MARFRVPTLPTSNVVIRLAEGPTETEIANRLVFKSYVAAGFWENDEKVIWTNTFLHLPTRHVFLVLLGDRAVGTMSIILDSEHGLPSDTAQPNAMRQLRAAGGSLAEVSAFATDQSQASNRRLVLFLMSYMFQYSLRCVGVDRLVASCVSTHAHFYESVLCFSRIGDPTYYTYTRVVGHLLSLDLRQTGSLFADRYANNPAAGESCYRFMFCEPQPCHLFPPVPPPGARMERALAKVA